jgi:hypothetical protein
MTATFPAGDFDSPHAQGIIHRFFDDAFFDFFVEGRPAAMRIEFGI